MRAQKQRDSHPTSLNAAQKGTEMTKRRTVRVAGVVAALAATGGLLAGGAAATAEEAKGPTVGTSIRIKNNDHPKFAAPEAVLAGADLQVINRTNPNRIGPHTFSLVERDQLPRTRDELKKCGNFKIVCKDIGIAHDAGPGGVSIRDVENGAAGWDATFDGQSAGDSWYTDELDETTSRVVSAGPGNLWFMCAIHPDMQGKVKVVDP
jgi:hypothetical protein